MIGCTKEPRGKSTKTGLVLKLSSNQRKAAISNCIATQVRDRAVRTAGFKPMHIQWCLTMKDNGTAKARIVLQVCQTPPFGSARYGQPTSSVRWRNLVGSSSVCQHGTQAQQTRREGSLSCSSRNWKRGGICSRASLSQEIARAMRCAKV